MAICLLNIVPSHFIKQLFAYVVIIVAIWMFAYNKDKDKDKKLWSLDSFSHHILTFFIGLVWFLCGVAVFTVPYLLKNGASVRRAVGSACIISAVFSVLAGVLLIFSGLLTVGISWTHIGYVNLPLLIFTLISSVIISYYCSKISLSVPEHVLKYGYAILVLISGVLMLL